MIKINANVKLKITKIICAICGAAVLLSGCSAGGVSEDSFVTVPLPTVTTTLTALQTTTAAPHTETEAEDSDGGDDASEVSETTASPTNSPTHAETSTASETLSRDTPAGAAPQDTEALYIKELFDAQKTDVWVSGKGTVTRILADDNSGDRHQRFFLELSTGQTLLVAHNIDIAPYLEGLAKGDTVSFYGEYYYSDEGGGIHWTHHDPDGSSDGGWLSWNGKTYK